MGVGDKEEELYAASTRLFVATVTDVPRPRLYGWWCAQAAARAIAQAYQGVAFDPAVIRLLPMTTNGTCLPPGGEIAIGRYIRVAVSADGRGQWWATTIGMQQFGLPNI